MHILTCVIEALIGKAQRFGGGRWAFCEGFEDLYHCLKAIKPGCGVLFERL